MSEQVVVVGVDGSPASYTALRWALSYTGRTGGLVRAVRGWTPIVARGWEAAVTAKPVPSPAEQEARAARELDQIVAAALFRVPHGSTRVAVQRNVAQGAAGPVLVAESAGADLLVIGHSPRSVSGRLHRSVSWYCAEHASCPVLVIPSAMATSRTIIPASAGIVA